MSDSESEPVRVLWLTKGLGPGGAERLLLGFAGRADHDRFELHAAYLLPWKDHLVAELDAAGVTVHPLRAPRVWDPRWLLRLRRLVREQQIDVVHLHSPLVAALARLALRTLPRGRRPALVTTEHNVWGSHHRVTRWLNRLTITGDDHVFAVSEQVAASMRTAARVEVLVHGVDVEAIGARRGERAGARAHFGLDDADLAVVTVANLRANKDYPTLLAAARRLVDEGLDVTFLAVGQGPLEAELAAERDRLGLGDRFRFLGYQPDPIRVLAAADLFCLSSRYEGLPIALLEALAMGLPVAATSVGGVPTVLAGRDDATLVEPGDPAALAEAIRNRAAAIRNPAGHGPAPGAPAGGSIDLATAVARQQEVYALVVDRA